jgi:predicted HNH restriction endonuclease
LNKNNITDISVLKNLSNLIKLDLRKNKIADISALKNLSKLVKLDLGKNQITDISALKNLPNLTKLRLDKIHLQRNNNISNFLKGLSLNLEIKNDGYDNPVQMPSSEVRNAGSEERKDKASLEIETFPVLSRNDNQAKILEFNDDDAIKYDSEVRCISDEELIKRIRQSDKVGIAKTVETTAYERNKYVSEFAKRKAKGICQLCENPAPFNDTEGNPYLESHHVIWLSRGGEDSVENVIALCPNCHTKMHILDIESDVEKLKRRAVENSTV